MGTYQLSIRSLLVVLALAGAGITFAQKPKRPVVYDLQEALQQKLVSLSVEGLGGYQGESLKVHCKNLSGHFIRVRIPLGQLMAPADTNEQTLVVAIEQTLALSAKTPVETTLQTFCTEAGDMSPSKGAAFSVGALASSQVCKLLKYLIDAGKTDSYDAQAAVWCLTSNRHGVASIGDAELAKFTAELKGVSLPEYKIRYQMEEEVPGRPADLGKALVVEGNFVFILGRDEITRMVLLDGDGKLIKQLSKDEVMKAGEHHTGMHLEVYNLPGNKYTLRLQTQAGRVIKDWDIAL